jgi:hypothetical protein
VNVYPVAHSVTVRVQSGPFRFSETLERASSEASACRRALRIVQAYSADYQTLAWTTSVAPDPRQPIERGDAA